MKDHKDISTQTLLYNARHHLFELYAFWIESAKLRPIPAIEDGDFMHKMMKYIDGLLEEVKRRYMRK